MKRIFLTVVSCAWAFAVLADDEIAFPVWQVSGSGTIVLPQGGSKLRRLGGGAARVSRYFSDAFAIEGEAAWLEDRTGLSVQGLWHMQGFEWFGKLFGYERFDPFMTGGVRGWLNEGQVGPAVGLGAFYYLSDDWAVRFDANLTLGLDTDVETIHALSLGLQYTF